MVITYEQGATTTLDTVLATLAKDTVGIFQAALELGVFPIRDRALANGLLSYETGHKAIQWNEGAADATQVILTTAIASSATTTFELTPIGAVKPNMVIRLKDECVLVISVDVDGGTCEVTRGFVGTPETAIADNSVGEVLSVTPLENAAAGDASLVWGQSYTNYVHEFEEVVQATDLSQVIASRTPEADIAYRILQKFQTLGVQVARALWHSMATGASATRRTMNGFKAQIDASMVSASIGDLTGSDIDDAVIAGMNNGTTFDTIFVPGTLKKALAAWDKSRISFGTQAPGVAGGEVSYFQSASGPRLQVVTDTSLLSSLSVGAEAFICKQSDLHAGWVPLLPQNVQAYPGAPGMTGIRLERLARTGPVDKVQMLGYATCQLARPTGAALLSGITGVDADGY
jgi:hypothetical protein